MPKKGESQGSVYYDKAKNRWVAQYYEENCETGENKRRKKLFKTKDEAEKMLATIMYQQGSSIYIQNNGIPLGALMRANLEKKFNTNLISEGQYVRTASTIALIYRLSPAISNRKIEEITSEDIQDCLNSMKHYSNSYIKKVHEQFTQAFSYAIKKGYIMKNPMLDVIKPKSLKKDKIVRALTVEEQQQFTKYLVQVSPKEEPYKNVFLLQMYMGMRVGEALALSNQDIDLKRNTIKVEKTLRQNAENRAVMGEKTKTYARK